MTVTAALITPGRRAPSTSPVLGASARLLVSRFSYGVTPTLTREVLRAGGARAWWEQQVATPYDPAEDAAAFDWWPNQHEDAATVWQRQVAEVEGSWVVMADYARRLLARRIGSPHQVREAVTEVLEGHLHVPTSADAAAFWRVPYGDVVRAHALGRFEDLLQEAVTHPAMLLYLNAATSTKAAPNENLGRELLELHTVGVGTYTEDDVKSAARVLTGWRVDQWRTWAASYQSRDHWVGPVAVCGFTSPNADPDGRAVTRALISHLARHPATARRVARRFAVAFVSDDPSDALVDRLAEVYLEADTAIVPVLRALISSPEFQASVGRKTRDPGQDVVATYRVLGSRLLPPTGEDSAAEAILWQTASVGAMPFAWPTPDGPPLESRAWATPSRVLGSMSIHWTMAGGWWPREDVVQRTPTDWLPQPRTAFADLVDHLARAIHGRRGSRALVRLCTEATGVGAEEVVDADHPLVRWGFPRLLAALLDHPHFYER